MLPATFALVFSLILTTREWVRLLRSRRAGRTVSALAPMILSVADVVAGAFWVSLLIKQGFSVY